MNDHIALLDKRTANRIAAGEVVTRPASVIKELCENSIDAGATQINIEIENGGMSKIFVSDNASGIHPDDIELAFKRNATSKTRNNDEYFGMYTLGFRGEALASICEVSKVRMTSRMHDAEIGAEIRIEGGDVLSKNECGCPEGTAIFVNELFYNVPARKKFIKSIGAETAACSDIASRLMLAYPSVSIKFSNNGKIVYHSPGKGLKNAVLAVYGREIYENLIDVEQIADDIKVSGVIGNSTISRKTRSFQTLIINKRIIEHSLISGAVSEAFSERMMIGRYPFFVISITIDPHTVDSNIHPQKQEMKLTDDSVVAEAVKSAVIRALSSKNDMRSVPGPKAAQDTKPQTQPMNNSAPMDSVPVPGTDTQSPHDRSVHKVYIPEELIAKANSFFGEFPKGCKLTLKSTDYDGEDEDYKDGTAEKAAADREVKEGTSKQAEQRAFSELPINDIRIIGQVFSTYLLAEYEDTLYIIDQHAAHERLNYDSYMKAVNSNGVLSQQLIVPVTIAMSPEEAHAVAENAEMLASIGFEVDQFGIGSVIVRAVPHLISQCAAEDSLLRLIELAAVCNITSSGAEVIKDKIIKTCCRMSIKAGDSLNKEEIMALIKRLMDEPKLTCPHGRPIVVTMRKFDLEKNFKRIQ